MTNKLILAILSVLLMSPLRGFCQTTSDYLILQDIGTYRLSQSKTYRTLAPVGGPKVGKNAGVVGSSHFPDHVDTTYEVMYLGNANYASPKVVVTQHAGGDSDKWLLHEIEDIYRDSNTARLGLVLQGALVRKVGANKVFSHGIGGGEYTWLSNNNVVVDISYTSLKVGTPNPDEIVQAYLAKFPSIIETTFVLDSAHDIVWIKDEIDRRLWLCDKWVLQIQPEDAKLYNKLDSIVSNMTVFLDYREKYFVISAVNEKALLLNYLAKKDDVSIKAKLVEYKTWWTDNKEKALNL